MKKTETLLTRPIVFFDLETTGIDVDKDRIIQIACVKIHPDGTREKKSKYLNPEISIPEEATKIHGITNQMVQNEPTFKQIAKGLREFMAGCHFGGYNSDRFDVPLLGREFERAGIDDPFIGCEFIDVYHLYTSFNRRRLEDAYKNYIGKDLNLAHNAEKDIDATIEIFESMLERHSKYLHSSIEHIANYNRKVKNFDFAGKIIINEKKERVFTFGKYKGQKVYDVFLKDEKYIYWLLTESDIPENTKKRIRMIKNAKGGL